MIPYPDGAAKIYKITPAGLVTVSAEGFTNILGLRFDCLGRLYVLEASAGNTAFPPFVVAGAGSVRRFANGVWETVVSGLTFPTAMNFGPDGNGQIVRADVGLSRQCRQ